MLLQRLKKLSGLGSPFIGQGGEILGDIADFAGDDIPSIGLQPSGHGRGGGAVGNEAGTRLVGGDVVVLLMGHRFDLVGTCLDGGLLEVDPGLVRIGLDETDMVKEELVAAGSTELSVTEENADLGGRAVGVVGVDLDDHRHLVGCIALEHNVVDDGLLTADSGPLVDGSLDDILGDALSTGLFQRSEEAGVVLRISAALTGGDRDFTDELAGGLRFLERRDLALREQPLATHGSGVVGGWGFSLLDR